MSRLSALFAMSFISFSYWNCSPLSSQSPSSTSLQNSTSTTSSSSTSSTGTTSFDSTANYSNDPTIPLFSKSISSLDIQGFIAFLKLQSNFTDPLKIQSISPSLLINVLDIGARGDGLFDNTTIIKNALIRAKSENKLLFIPSGKYLFKGSLQVDGVQVIGEGDSTELISLDPQDGALFLKGNQSGLSQLKLSGVISKDRQSAWESCRVVVFGAQNFRVENLSIDKSSAAGIHVTNESSYGVIRKNRINGTLADSIHITQKSHHILVAENSITNSGDDGIAVVSYVENNGDSHNIIAAFNQISKNLWGRNLSVVGGTDIFYFNNQLFENTMGAACIYIAQENSWSTRPSTRVEINSNQLTQCGSLNLGHGAITVFNEGTGTNENIQFFSNSISNSEIGVAFQGADNKKLMFKDNRFLNVDTLYQLDSLITDAQFINNNPFNP